MFSARRGHHMVRKGYHKPRSARILSRDPKVGSPYMSLFAYLVLDKVIVFEGDNSVLVALCFGDGDVAASVVVAVRTSIPLDGRDATDC